MTPIPLLKISRHKEVNINFRPLKEIFRLNNLPFWTHFLPWRLLNTAEAGMPSVSFYNNEFHIILDVRHFKPNELKIKVEKEYLVIEGKHEERRGDYGFFSERFTRRCKIPEDVDEAALAATVSSGVLTLKAAKKNPPEAHIISIPIMHSKL